MGERPSFANQVVVVGRNQALYELSAFCKISLSCLEKKWALFPRAFLLFLAQNQDGEVKTRVFAQ